MPRRRPTSSRKPAKHSSNSVKPAPSTLRIIGGEWRSRKLAFHPAEGLRPTLDRVRETLFNWLSPYIEGAHCLDLFSGSGALTLEALSRGASFVHINELNPEVRNTLHAQLEVVSCDPSRYQLTGFNGETPPTDSLPDRFDILFLDPPFRKELLESCCQTLETLSIFKPRSWIYLESEQPLEQLALPNNWQLIKQKKAGQTHYGLVERIEKP